jgi:Ser/Thr protein kinase RdoA (MazF antagonist)
MSSFFNLDPEMIMQAAESAGFQPTGEFSQLNSYENRVFDLRLESGQSQERLIAKFYRPGRWSLEALKEEHEFLFDLQKEGLPVIAPLIGKNNSSLLQTEDIWVAFFPKFVGRMPEEFLQNDLYQVGRRLAQIHNIGARKDFRHRAIIGDFPYSMEENLDFLERWIAPEVKHRYLEAAETVVQAMRDYFDPESFIRIHGDCHRGNLLSRSLTTGREFSFVDFDDCSMGPEVQDFWMLFSGLDSENEQDLILSGYEELRDFPHTQLRLVPWLRGLRIFSYAAWIARRWEDPSFPRLFPEFNSYSYWAEETEAIEKIAWSSSTTD